jgi:hypothetical protein
VAEDDETTQDDSDYFAGLAGLSLEAEVPLGRGICLRPATAQFRSPLMLLNPNPTGEAIYPALPRPAFWSLGGETTEITAEIVIPHAVARSWEQKFRLARLLVFVIRLWSDPAVSFHAHADRPFSSLASSDDGKFKLAPVETGRRYFHLGLVDGSRTVASLKWVQDNWETAHRLYRESTEFRLAADALDTGQFIFNTALTMVSLWGALEATFSPATSELRFRVSALIAAYLEPPGPERLKVQKEVASLYDKRSAAAHGRPKHEADDLVKTFELLRRVIIRMIAKGAVPTRDDLERALFVGK